MKKITANMTVQEIHKFLMVENNNNEGNIFLQLIIMCGGIMSAMELFEKQKDEPIFSEKKAKNKELLLRYIRQGLKAIRVHANCIIENLPSKI